METMRRKRGKKTDIGGKREEDVMREMEGHAERERMREGEREKERH